MLSFIFRDIVETGDSDSFSKNKASKNKGLYEWYLQLMSCLWLQIGRNFSVGFFNNIRFLLNSLEDKAECNY